MAIADKNLAEICEHWLPKSTLRRSHKVATFGSCFAKMLGPWVKERGFSWFDAERAPDIFVCAVKEKYNYGIFSARTDTINSATSLRQWVSWAIGVDAPSDGIWQIKGRYFDPFRPSIEPNGFATPEELLTSRRVVLRAIRDVVDHADWFVFTLGHSYAQADSDLDWVIDAISAINKKIRFVLSVSAIPFAANGSARHELTPAPNSKSYLCGLARTIAEKRSGVDYFPSYEIITAPLFQAILYDRDKQTPSRLGAKFVMDCFFSRSGEDAPSVIEVEGAPGAGAGAGDSSDDEARAFWSRIRMTRKSLRGLV